MAEERCKYTEVRIRTLLPPVISEIGRFLAWGTLAGPLPARRECLACHIPRDYWKARLPIYFFIMISWLQRWGNKDGVLGCGCMCLTLQNTMCRTSVLALCPKFSTALHLCVLAWKNNYTQQLCCTSICSLLIRDLLTGVVRVSFAGYVAVTFEGDAPPPPFASQASGLVPVDGHKPVNIIAHIPPLSPHSISRVSVSLYGNHITLIYN